MQNVLAIKKFHKSLRHNRKTQGPCGNFLTLEEKRRRDDDIIPTSVRENWRKKVLLKDTSLSLSFFIPFCRSLTAAYKLNQIRNERRCRASKLCMPRNSILININFHKWMSTARGILETKKWSERKPNTQVLLMRTEFSKANQVIFVISK